MLERIQVVAEVPAQPRRHFESRGDQKPADTSDTTDQDVPGDETHEIAKLELAHEVEDGACEHRAQGVCRDSRGNDGVGLVFADYLGDSARHVVEEGYNFDLPGVSHVLKSLRPPVLTNSEPTPPLNMLPVEKVICEMIQLT